ncbi:MAG: hypothetical protein PHI24_10335 [Desulfitobacteriaceae bacterium]|nr:hypothetical protein [Desulfitobacteriaceae bacterium]
MSLKIVTAEIERFLKAPEPEVLVIRGEWGTGKTYAWKNHISRLSSSGLPTSRYSYVSLFGVNSLYEFKFLLFQQSIPNATIGTEPSMASFKENASGFAESFGRKGFKFFERLPVVKDFASEIRSFAFLSLRNTLICIDDVERKGRDLDVREILGVVSQLKEEKACKVVLIMNQSGLDDDNDSQFEKYREKVIDVELAFAPTVQECASIGLDQSQKLDARLVPLVLKLGIKNIRIIFRIKRLVRIVFPHLERFEPEVLQQAIHSLTLFTWCYLSDDAVSPNYEFVKKSGLGLMGLRDEEASEDEKAWNSVLQGYGLMAIDEFDLVLAELVETGYVDAEKLDGPASTLNAQVIADKGDKSFGEAWRLYHDSFENNQEQVVEMIFKRFKENVKYITPLNLNGTVSLLRELRRDDLADQCIEHYILNRKDQPKLFDLDSYAFAGDITDEKIKDAFAKTFVDIEPELSLRDAIARIADKQGWGRKDIEVMSAASEGDYYDLFKAEKGEHLRSFVIACLQFKRISGTSEKEQSISSKAEAALKRIGSESDVNRRRVASYGVEVDAK